MAKPIALAADHGGFELKEAVKHIWKSLVWSISTLAPTAPTAWTTPIWLCPPVTQW